MKKRILSVLLCLVMVVGLLPTAALAADTDSLTVTFEANGGSGTMASEQVTKDPSSDHTDYTLPDCGFGAPEGKIFEGWRMADQPDGEVFAAGTEVWLYTSVILAAVWADKYTVSFNGNGGDGSMYPVDVKKTSGTTKYTAPENGGNFAPPEGKAFQWWVDDDGQYISGGTEITLTKNITLTARWGIPVTALNFTINGYAIGSGVTSACIVPDMATQAALYDNPDSIPATADSSECMIGTGYNTSTGEIIGRITEDSVTFAEGTTYYLVISLEADDDYSFKGLTKDKIKLGGIAAKAIYPDGDGCGIVCAIFELAPLTSGGTTPPAPTTYAVTVNGSEVATTGAGNYAEGATVAINAGTKGGYTFKNWTSDDGVTFADANSASTSFTMPAKPVTVTANWTKNSSGGGGGGVSTYTITVEDAKNGDVKADRKSASSGTTVTITVDPDKGYTLETLTVLDKNGKEVKLTNKGSGKYTFKMPASKVTVKAAFTEDNSMLNFFVDVPSDAYYADAVLWAAENGITGGVDAVHFAPNATCTRAQAVTFLWRAAGSPAPKSTEMPFADVKADSYYYNAVLWAVENGITKGTSETTFSPDVECSRAQIVTFLWRSQKSPAVDAANPFVDVIADAYYTDAVLWAAANGITGGTTATTFTPGADCTRAQIVTFIYRLLGE